MSLATERTPFDPRALPWWETALGVALVAVLQMMAVLNPDVVEVDSEEMYNAGQAWMISEGYLGELFRLQYRDYCGGCSLDAVLGAGIFSVLGRSWLAWKAVPLLFLVAVTVVGSRGLYRLAGRPAAWAFVLLLALPPRAWMFLSVIAWGNHYEAGCVALCGLVLLLGLERAEAGPTPRVLLAGAVLGLAAWIGFSGLFALLAAVLFLILSGRARVVPKLLAGAALGLAPWAVQWWSTGQHPFVTVYESGESAPSLARVPYKLSTLLRPRQLVGLFGSPHTAVGWWLGWVWAGALSVAGLTAAIGSYSAQKDRWRDAFRATLLFLTSWLAIYCVVRFQVYDPPPPEIAYPTSMRYGAPLYPLAFFLLSLAVGYFWSSGRRALAIFLLIGPLASGGLARWESVQSPFPAASLQGLEAVDWEHFRPGFGYRISPAALGRAPSSDQRAQQLQAYALGREGAAALLRTDSASLGALTVPSRGTGSHAGGLWPGYWWEGVGEAVAKHLGPSGQPEGDSGGWPERLSGVDRLLRSIPGSASADWDTALKAAAALDPSGRVDWIKVQGGWDRAAVPRLLADLAARSPGVAQASWHAHGRACGAAIARFHLPESVDLGRELARIPPVFFGGLGHALGERWGPLEVIPTPRGMPAAVQDHFLRGYEQGARRRWLAAGPGYEARLSVDASRRP
ncbi:MAG: hypothetical protein CL928_11860 [Deltaproteobacteria bacterium]|nr:hypothetical protein [Deltaproteobacteria bacterium]